MLASDQRFSSFMSALAATFPLSSKLEAPVGKKLTVFAPTNSAFAALTPKSLSWLLGNKGALTKVLQKHVVAGYDARIPRGYSKLKSVGGSRITFHRYLDGEGEDVVDVKTRSGGARLEDFDILAADGIVHAIDSLIL